MTKVTPKDKEDPGDQETGLAWSHDPSQTRVSQADEFILLGLWFCM